MKKADAKGFTLVELMIVVVIVGVLAAVGISSYQDSIQKSRLENAKGVLVEAANMLERSYSLNAKYPTASAYPAALQTAPKAGEGTAYFDIVYQPGTGDTTYRLVARVKGTYLPSTCRTLKLTSAGEKLASDSSVADIASPGTAAVNRRCWG